MKKQKADIVIVGAGAAGLFTALTLAPRKVVVLSAQPLGGISASCWAQGGIAAAVDKEDSAQSHAADTLKAGAGTSDPAVVKRLVEEAPAYVKILEKYGVNFERDENGAFALSREACHARRRVLKAKAGDGFGAEMMRALVEEVKKTPSIIFVEKVSAERVLVEDGKTQGVLARTAEGESIVFEAPAVVLATGGAGGLYAATTNPLGAVGRGIAMAYRAGAVLSDLEFVQFHPTALDIMEDPSPLATEALRGEGAYLRNSRGERFVDELLPRDEVSRAIFAQMQKGQRVYLDCRHIDVSHFPALLGAAKRAGIDPQRDLIPVHPAVHYHMGGVATDLNGKSSVAGLWACGEVAATGLHGANRLASNSLMEAVVMGGRVAADIAARKFGAARVTTLPMVEQTAPFDEMRYRLRQLMSEKVGVIRDEKRMKEALEEIAFISRSAKGDAGLEDMALVAKLITESALNRTESRGGHCRSDYPETQKKWQKRSFITQTKKEVEKVA